MRYDAGFVIRCCSIAAVAFSLAGCPTEETCVEVDPAGCEPLYAPTFDNVYANTLEPKCAAAGPCHSASHGAGGMKLSDPDSAYDALMNGRLIPGDAGCSLMVRRLESSERGFQMPPNNPLPERERCSIIQWIEAGAPR